MTVASSPGSGDKACLSLSFNWMQTSFLAPITDSSVAQTGIIRYHNIITIQISMLRRCVVCLS